MAQIGIILQRFPKVTAGGTVSEEEYETLTSLGEYAARLKQEIVKAVDYFSDGRSIGKQKRFWTMLRRVQIHSTMRLRAPPTNYPISQLYFMTVRFPTMSGKKSLYFWKEGRGRVDAARETRQKLTGLSDTALTHVGDNEGSMPLYNFTADGLRVSVTKTGGFPVSLLRSRGVDTRTLSERTH